VARSERVRGVLTHASFKKFHLKLLSVRVSNILNIFLKIILRINIQSQGCAKFF